MIAVKNFPKNISEARLVVGKKKKKKWQWLVEEDIIWIVKEYDKYVDIQ